MSSASKGNILFFEDDEDVSELVVDYLTEQNYQVNHYPAYPGGGVETIRGQSSSIPDVVIMDINLPGKDGYEICRLLKQEYLGEDVPVLFSSGRLSEDDILKAYDSGADDFHAKPIRLKELEIKIEQYQTLKQQREAHKEQTGFAQKMAFEAMATSSELGEILRFHEALHLITELDELADLLLKAIAQFSLTSSIMFFTDKTHYFCQEGEEHPLEQQVLNAFKGRDRIYSWKNKTFFNYELFSVLIKNMPIDDEERYGVLKDQLCILLNGVDARVKAILIEESNKRKSVTMKIAADTIANMVMEIENDNVELSQNFERIILKMEGNIGADIIQFSLLENEEKVLMDHVMLAIKESSEVFDTSIAKEKQYKEIMTRLLKDLMSND